MRNHIWIRALDVPNLKYERLVDNSAKVVPLQVFGKFRLLLPYVVLHHNVCNQRRMWLCSVVNVDLVGAKVFVHSYNVGTKACVRLARNTRTSRNSKHRMLRDGSGSNHYQARARFV